MKLTDVRARKVWDEYMDKIAATDYGVEVLNDPLAHQKRRKLVDELKMKLKEMGVEV